MATETVRPTRLTVTEPRVAAFHLLNRTAISAWAGLAGDAVLITLFLWGVNPSNLVYSLGVLVQSGVLLTLVAVAIFLPAATLVGVRWVRQTVREGQWARARQWLPFLVGVGYAAWIVPGFFLHETLHLLNARTRAGSGSPAARSAP